MELYQSDNVFYILIKNLIKLTVQLRTGRFRAAFSARGQKENIAKCFKSPKLSTKFFYV